MYSPNNEPLHLSSLRANLPQIAQAQEKLFFEAGHFFETLAKDIESARVSICVEMYIWSNDEVGKRFWNLLEAAARRGVRVRIVMDGVGSWFWLHAHQAQLDRGLAELRIYRPVRWPALGKGGFHRFVARMNQRNHKKVILIDDEVAFTGSMNFTHRSLLWKECGLRVTGPSVPLLKSLFDDIWARAGENGDRHAVIANRQLSSRLLASHSVRSNQFYQLRNRHMHDLKRRIQNAGQRVWLVTPYFVPNLGLFLALLKAAKRGVDVRLILPRKSDVWFTRWVAHLHYRFMLKAGIKVYEYLPRILHAKISLVDGWAFVGSSNMNRRSAYLDLELDIVLKARRSVELLEEEFKRDLRDSEKVQRHDTLQSWRSTLAKIFYLWRGWL